MTEETVNTFLEVLSLLNDGTDNGTSYSLDRLPDATSLDESLARYFSAMSTSLVPPRPAEDWHIRAVQIDGDWRAHIECAVRTWFFQQRYSPSVTEYTQKAMIDRFCQHLIGVVDGARAFAVATQPPMWYECDWIDYAFETQNGRWLLHLGFSD